MRRRFEVNDELFAMYKEAINSYATEGYARRMKEQEISAKSSKTWYLPPPFSISPQKSSKVRVAFDAASKFKEESLSKNLHTGPDLLNSLVRVLLRFWNYKIALVTYVVKFPESDMYSIRFLKAEDPFQVERIDTFQMTVHILSSIDLPCCTNYTLKRVGRDSRTEFSSAPIEAILKSFYADDLLKSVVAKQEVIDLVKELLEAMKRGQFWLTKFSSNDEDVMKYVLESERNKSVQYTFVLENTNEGILGVN